jgi:hypothetical protein
MISRAVLLSLFVGCLALQAAFAGQANPAPGGNNNQMTGFTQNATDSLYAQKQRVRSKNQFSDAYWNTVQHEPYQEVYQPTDGTQKTLLQLDGQQYMNKVTPAAQPTRAEALGWILPTGYYMWDGRLGIVPNPTMAMPGYTSPVSVQDSGLIGPTMALLDAVDPSHNLRTTTITNQDFGAIMAARGVMVAQLRNQPDRWRSAMQSSLNMKEAVQSDNTAEGAEQNMNAGWDTVALPLINIANEEAWQPTDPENPWKSYAQAAWMVGQMYKQVYIPMGILLLLPGAVLTQVKIIAKVGTMPQDSPVAPDMDMVSPFSGIMRAMIAVFLIPATQLFVSYTIDVGNSLTYEIVNCQYWDLQMLKDWRNQQTYDAKPQNQQNYFSNVPESGMQGKIFGTPDDQVVLEKQNYVTGTNQQWFNQLQMLLGQGMVALNAFQLVIIMYLFLMGPIAASLYAWPGTVGSNLFTGVYSAWMDGVVLVTLWKFWWAVILLVMMIRLDVNAANNMAAGLDPIPPATDQFEAFMCASFCTLLMYVPFNPFDFQPGSCVKSVLDSANQQVSKAGSGAAVVGSAGAGGLGGGQGAQGSSIGEGPSGTGARAR